MNTQSWDGISVVLALMNLMVGSVTLVLPLLFLQSGTIVASLVVVLSAGFACYSCYVFLLHLDETQKDLPLSLQRHFTARLAAIPQLYCGVTFVNLTLTSVTYFMLVCAMWKSLLGVNEGCRLDDSGCRQVVYWANSFVLFATLLVADFYQVVLRVACYGSVSIVTYFGIIIWLFTTNQNAGVTPYVPFATGKLGPVAGCMALVFSIQACFVPILKKIPQPKHRAKCLYLAFFLAAIAYVVLGTCGAYGIAGRTKDYGAMTSILDFFNRKDVIPFAIQIGYLLHLYSVFLCFVSMARERLVQLCGLTSSPVLDFLINLVILALATGLQFLQIPLYDFMAFNGACTALFFTYLIPNFLHLKCVHYPEPSSTQQIPMPQQNNPQQANTDLQEQIGQPQIQSLPPVQLQPPQVQSLGYIAVVRGVSNNSQQQRNIQGIQLNDVVIGVAKCPSEMGLSLSRQMQIGIVAMMACVGVASFVYNSLRLFYKSI